MSARLPPGQVLTRKWPVLHYSHVPRIDTGTWRFAIGGLVEHPLSLSWSELDRFPRQDITCDIHCVTSWSRFDNRFSGVPVSALLAEARPLCPSAPPPLRLYRRHHDVGDAARDDEVEQRQIGADVEREAVHRHPLFYVDADARDLARATAGPHSGLSGIPPGGNAERAETLDQDRFQLAEVPVEIAAPAVEVEDRIPDELAGGVQRDIASWKR